MKSNKIYNKIKNFGIMVLAIIAVGLLMYIEWIALLNIIILSLAI